jgi:hypothetical protein
MPPILGVVAAVRKLAFTGLPSAQKRQLAETSRTTWGPRGAHWGASNHQFLDVSLKAGPR